MLGLYVTGQEPFHTVYTHGMVVDEKGQKFSKSKGNAIGVVEAIEQYGADAVRMGLVLGHTAGSNQPFTAPKFIAARNFANKLWNIARYVEDKIGETPIPAEVLPTTVADHWVLSKLQHYTKSIQNHLDNYRLGDAYDELYHFVWDDVADWYIEGSKTDLNLSVLHFVLQSILKIAHPFAPFVTEAIWQTMHEADDKLLIREAWPKIPDSDAEKAAQFEEIKTIVSEVRYITSALQAQKLSLYFQDAPFIAENAGLIMKLAKLARVQEVGAGKGMHLTTTPHNAWLDVDIVSAKHYAEKLEEDKAAKQVSIERLNGRLSNTEYVKHAPRAIVAETKKQLEDEKALLAKLESELTTFRQAFGS